MEYCNQALELTVDPQRRARIYGKMVMGYDYERFYLEALSCCETALTELKNQNESLEMAYLWKHAASILSHLGRSGEAIFYADCSLRIMMELGNDKDIAAILSEFSAIYLNQDDSANALSYGLKALEFAEKSGDKLAMGEAYYGIGYTYCAKGKDIGPARMFLEKALTIFNQLGNTYKCIWTAQLLGILYMQLDDFDSAINEMQRLLALSQQYGGMTREAATAHGWLACLFFTKGMRQEANSQFIKALDFSEYAGSIYIEIAGAFALLKQPEESLMWLERGLPRMSDSQISGLGSYIWLKSLHNDPRFIQLQGYRNNQRHG
jgi:tetratricopeptide (TPR) repeat protein